MASHFRPFRMTRPLPALIAVAAGLALAVPAQAQTRGYYSADPNVTIDLSVLGGPGNEPGGTAPAFSANRPGTSADTVHMPDGLLFPPPAVPPSRLNGQFATKAPPVLRRPAANAATEATTAPQSRLTAAPPAAMPEPVRPASPAPAMPAKAASAPPSQAAPPMAPKPPAAPAVTAPPVMPPAPVKSAARDPAPPPPSAVPPPPSLPQPAAAPTPTPPPAPATATGASNTRPESIATATRSSATTPTAPAAGSAPADAATVAEVRVLFDGDSAKLPDNARDSLLSLVGKLEANESLRLQIEAYAAGTAETASQARRLSLSRALSVRSYLIEQGVRSTRMDVRALGNKASEPPAPADRVDARIVER